MQAKLALALAIALGGAGCAGLQRGVTIDPRGGLPVRNPAGLTIAAGAVEVGEGGAFRPAIWWQPSFWSVLPLPAERFREKVVRVLEGELADGGFAGEGPADYVLHVTIEELGLVTRGDEREGTRSASAVLRCELRSGDVSFYEAEATGESRYTGSGVRRSPESTLFRPLYIYETAEPDPIVHAARKAMRRFLHELPQAALHEARPVRPAGPAGPDEPGDE